MKCVICKKVVAPRMNSVVCSDGCLNVWNKINELMETYFPAHGCDNCREDLHRGCSEQCKEEFNRRHKFGGDVWSLVRLVIDLQKENQ